MSTGWNRNAANPAAKSIINLLGNEYWLELRHCRTQTSFDYKPTGK